MAIYENLANKINNIDTQWEGHSGQEVEDFVCRHIITGGEYNSQEQKLYLHRKGNTSLSMDVTVETPVYIYGMILYGIRLDGKDIKTGSELLMQYRSGRKVELGVAIQSVAERSGKQSTINKEFDLTIDMITNNESQSVKQTLKTTARPTSHEYFKTEGTNLVLDFPENVDLNTAISWIDVTKMFTKSFKNYTFNAYFEYVEDSQVRKVSNSLNMNIINEVIKLVYNGDIIINNNYIQMTFDPTSTNTNDYKLIIINGDTVIQDRNPGDMQVSNLHPGLNQLQLMAVHKNNPDVYTDWFYVDVIYTEGVTDTVVAVNGVSEGITNNGVATLYQLTVYSPKQEEFEITTYLDDEQPDQNNPNPVNIIKTELINPSQYNIETNSLVSQYKKYIEINSDNAQKYLVVKLGNEFYKFYTPYVWDGQYFTSPYSFKTLAVDPIIEEYTYVKTYPTNYNFDQMTGYINNVFVTKNYETATTPQNISDTLESSDGWHENEGRAYFKVSANVNPLFKTPLNLNLGNNFTIELGFKSYNISNIDNPVLTLGKLQIRPTMVCWDIDKNKYSDLNSYNTAFLGRVSKFQENIETHVIITLDSNWSIDKSKDTLYYPDYLQGDNQITFDTNSSKYTHNLLRIYINGGIDREIFLDDAEVIELKNSILQINPTSSDIDFYLFRVYNNNSLRFDEIVRNRIAFVPEKTGKYSKEFYYNQNDILNDNGLISWEKCQGKLNTLLFVFPQGGRFPNRFWGGQDGDAEEDVCKKVWTSLFINYADPEINVKYGGRLNKLQVKGQGSSAMRYLIWNVNSSLNKFKDENDKKIKSVFTPNGILNTKSIPENYTGISSLKEISGKYIMPPYDGQVDTTEYGYTKMVGKVNYASSMQSHKPGSCKLFDDAYKSSVRTTLPSGGLKAVQEEPFLYFYIEAPEMNNKQCSELTWDDVLSMTDRIKFMGFQTWGPGKGDDTCSGYDEDITPEYLMLEGGENGDNSVNFLVPWHNLQRLSKIPGQESVSFSDLQLNPVCTEEESLADPSRNLLISDESVVYMQNGAWDIDYGIEEVEAGDKGAIVDYFKFANGVIKSPGGNDKSSLQWFREFYDFVYKYDFTFISEPTNIKEPQENWDTSKKYMILSTTFSQNGKAFENHKPYDLYRYDRINNIWVPAGLFYKNGEWTRLNYTELSELNIQNKDQSLIRRALEKYFRENIGKYVDVVDIAFHQAFVKFLSGTDNRAKNTYFQIIGPQYSEQNKVDSEGNPVLNEDGEQETEFVMGPVDESTYKIRLIGDDLDTVLATDNNGLQSKAYNLIEDSYDSQYNDVWGDLGNLFFRMFDISFENDIKTQLRNIMNVAGITSSSVNNSDNYFYKVFFKIQEDFPAIAYNHTAKIYYENAAIIKEVGEKHKYSFEYKHNNVNPIEQSHGSSLECEKQFMKERLGFLSGYAQAGLDGYIKTSDSGGSGAPLRLKIEFEPYQDFYPNYQFGTSGSGGETSFGKLQETLANPQTYQDYQINSNIRSHVALKDHKYSVEITTGTTPAINQGLYQVNLYKTLNITGLTYPSLTGSFDRVTTFEIDNNNLNIPFFKGWTPLTINSNNAQLPVIQNLNLKNINLPDTLSLNNYYKLQNLDLSGSITKYVEFPQTGNLKQVILPSSITTFRIYNNPGLESVQILTSIIDDNGNIHTEEDLSNLKTIYIDCSKCGQFNVEEFCEKLTNVSSLEEITLVNANNLKMTENTISILSNKKCRFTGSYQIVDNINSENPQIVAISFETKKQLVNNFGVITDINNDTYIKYKELEIYANNVSCQERINLYLSSGETSASFENAFGLQINSGNNVQILENENNPYNPSVKGRLNIKYSLVSTSGVSKIDEKTGIITITGTSDKEDIITITIVPTKGTPISINCTLVCSWVAPQIGDFAYADGTFSSAYNKFKTLIGLVYDKNSQGTGESETGIAYIIGKEYSCNPEIENGYNEELELYSGVSYVADDKITGNGPDISNLKYLIEKLGLTNYDVVSGINSNFTKSDLKISKANYSKILNSSKSGKEDTLCYINHVKQFLEILRTKDINNTYSSYYNKQTGLIENNDNLLQFLNKLTQEDFLSDFDNSVNNDYTLSKKEYNKTILYPYFYSMYLYQPNVSQEELNDSNKFKDAYKRTNWYAPSIGELSKVLYQRALGESSNFNDSHLKNQNLNNISDELSIFAKAKNKMGNDIPQPWVELFKIGNNITTSIYTTSTDNYGYSIWDSGNGINSEWEYGAPDYNTDNSNYTNYLRNRDKIWRLNIHNGIPFTQYEYAKPN